MNDRYYKRFICIALCVVMICMLIGCTEASAPAEMGVEQMTLVDWPHPFRVYRHDSTGVYYLVNNYGGTTVMVNADGTPYTGVN